MAKITDALSGSEATETAKFRGSELAGVAYLAIAATFESMRAVGDKITAILDGNMASYADVESYDQTN